MNFVSYISLKTKGFSRKTEALIWIGGGEIRTLVLSKHPTRAYMLIASVFLVDLTGRRPISDLRAPSNLGDPLPRGGEEGHTRVNDDIPNVPGQALGYRN